jgi:hypothetical protein
MVPSVTRALTAIRRHNARPEQIDHVILAAINVTLCLLSGGDNQVAEGFNHDLALDRTGLRSPIPKRTLARTPAPELTFIALRAKAHSSIDNRRTKRDDPPNHEGEICRPR